MILNMNATISSPHIDDGRSLTEKIASSNIFFVLGTKNYIEEIKNGEKEILESAEIAKRLKIDTIILIDKSLNDEDIKLLKKHTQDLKIVRTVVGNLYDKVFLLRIINETKDVYGYDCC